MKIHKSLYASRPLACGLLALALGTAGPAGAADLVVTSLADTATAGDGCTLRQAITAANANADFQDCAGEGAYGADTITFGVGGTITLQSPLPGITDPAGLTLDGTGQSITVSGANQFQVLAVDVGATLALHHLTVADGFAILGGGIRNFGGTITVTASTFSGNSAGSSGGGIFNSVGTVTVTASTFSGNSAASGGGGIYNPDLSISRF